MEADTTHDCIYVTAGWGIHDERWFEALKAIGRKPRVVSHTNQTDEILKQQVNDVANASGLRRPVLAGPLHSITKLLSEADVELIGLSWGYDLIHLHEQEQDISWLTRLRSLIVDSASNGQIAGAAGLPESRITFLPWGIELERFPFNGGDRRLPIVLTLRAHESMYRVDDVLRAFALIKDAEPAATLVVGHSGSQTDELKKLSKDLEIHERTSFIGSVTEEELVPLLHRASAYVSASEVDGTSVTLLQAMACGAPVIATDIPGNRAWVEEGVTGSVFPVGDVPALATTLLTTIRQCPTDATRNARAQVEVEADWARNLVRLQQAMEI